jgi:hypothetical protein
MMILGESIMPRDRDYYLFTRRSLHGLVEAQGQALHEEIAGLSNSAIQGTEEGQLIESLRDKYYLDAPQILDEDIEVEQSDTKIDVSYDRMRLTFGPGPHYIDASKFTYHIPFKGDPDLLQFQPSRFTTMIPYAKVEGNNMIIEVDVENIETTDPDNQMQGELNRIKQYLGWVEQDVAEFNKGLEDRVRTALSARKANLEKTNSALAGSKYKIRSKPGAPTTYPTNSIQRKSPIVISTTGGQRPEPTLPEKQYEHILEVITSTGNSIERSPATYKSMGEEALRDIFLAQLNGHYQGKAMGEAFNASGKTDILIRDQDRTVFIGECKIWGGDKLFVETIDQLLGYTSWRDTKTALIIFNRNKDLSAVLAKIPDLVKSHPNFKRELPNAGETNFRYVIHHNDDKARELYMAVIVVELPT